MPASRAGPMVPNSCEPVRTPFAERPAMIASSRSTGSQVPLLLRQPLPGRNPGRLRLRPLCLAAPFPLSWATMKISAGSTGAGGGRCHTVTQLPRDQRSSRDGRSLALALRRKSHCHAVTLFSQLMNRNSQKDREQEKISGKCIKRIFGKSRDRVTRKISR
jgi:hypothetical protein